MSDVPLKSYEFRREREPAWRELEGLLSRSERSDIRSLSATDLARLPVLHRAALSSFLRGASHLPDRNVVAYLEGLCTRPTASSTRPAAPSSRPGHFLRVRSRAVRAHRGLLLLAAL
jgi:hypothetical protein